MVGFLKYNRSAIAGSAVNVRPVKEIANVGGAQLLANRVMLDPFSYPAFGCNHTIFISNVIFCDTFSVDALVENTNVIIENCTFNMRAELKNFRNSKLIIRNCMFNDELYIGSVQTDNLEIFGTTHYGDVIINDIAADAYFAEEVKILNNHLLFLNDCNVTFPETITLFAPTDIACS